MKSIITALFLLAAIAGRSQTKITNFAWDNIDVDTVPTTLLATGQTTLAHWIRADTVTPLYDTLKVIAEVYILPRRIRFAVAFYWDNVAKITHTVYDSIWVRGDSTSVLTVKVLAWEVWTKRVPGNILSLDDDPDPGRPRLVKRLSYNRKDELSNVLQTWRVEW